MTKVVLTSFRDADKWDSSAWSVARWQPSDCGYFSLPFFAPWDPDTNRGMVHLEPDVFKEKYERVLDLHHLSIVRFVKNVAHLEQVVLLCWCHPDRQRDYDKLYCHTILIGHYLEKHFPELKVVYADGRESPLWERKE